MRRVGFVFFDYGVTIAYSAKETPAIVSDILEERGYVFPIEEIGRAYQEAEAYWEKNISRLGRPRTRYLTLFHVKLLSVLGVQKGVEEIAKEIDPEWYVRAKFRLFPDVLPCLQTLREMNVPMGIISQNLLTQEQLGKKTLRLEGIEDYFTVLVTSESAGYDKPDPRLFLKAAEMAGHPPSQILSVGDSYEMDVKGASAAGMMAVLLDRSGKSGLNGGQVISSLSEHPKLLG
jgi:HAD superfamily hydrolase (TIGR01549 family)